MTQQRDYLIKKQTADDVNGTNAGWKHGNEYFKLIILFSVKQHFVYVIYNHGDTYFNVAW